MLAKLRILLRDPGKHIWSNSDLVAYLDRTLQDWGSPYLENIALWMAVGLAITALCSTPDLVSKDILEKYRRLGTEADALVTEAKIRNGVG